MKKEEIEVLAREAMKKLHDSMYERGVTTTLMFDIGIPLVVEAIEKALPIESLVKISICKIWMIGSPVLILGVGKDLKNGTTHWDAYQVFTGEDLVGQEHIDQTYLKKLEKFWGKEVHFKSINKSFPIKQFGHDFNFKEYQEITEKEFELLQVEMKENWDSFDDETWGK